MKYAELLFKHTDAKPFPIDRHSLVFDKIYKKWVFTFKIKDEVIYSNTLSRLYAAITTFFVKYNASHYIFCVSLGSFKFADKNVYIFFDMLAYYVLKEAKFDFEVSARYPETFDLQSVGFQNTALHNFMINQQGVRYIENKTNFINYYEQRLHLTNSWYRVSLTRADLAMSDIASEITTDIGCFLSNNKASDTTVENMLNVVAELISNTEHNDGDCILDIDICAGFINVSFVNLFSGRMFDKLQEMFDADTLSPKAHEIIQAAIKYHAQHFTETYTQDDFYFISTFQEDITTRQELSGGTGLTKIINVIAKEDENTYSYVLSGYNLLFLRKGFLGDGGKEIGFNNPNDYYYATPDKAVLSKCNLYIPGVAFQLIFKFEESIHATKTH